MFYCKLSELYGEFEAFLINSPYNLRYFTGYRGGEGVAVIGKNFRYLFVDSRYTTEATEEARDFSVIEFTGANLLSQISDALKSHRVNILGYENLYLTVYEYEKYVKAFENTELVGVGNALNTLRMVKTEEEIELMRKAEHIGDITFERILPMLRVGVSECELAAEIEYQMRLLGAEGPSFETIVVSGKKTSMPHGKADDKRIESGDLVTMDFGCIYKGYCSDMTRTVAIEKINDEQKLIYDTVLKAQLAGLEAIESGIEGKRADASARSVIADAGFGKYFGHSLGHGVGLQIHEMPNLAPASDIVLKENCVVTCEPGIYIGGVGGVRIEDMVVVKRGGIENLAFSPKELIICG